MESNENNNRCSFWWIGGAAGYGAASLLRMRELNRALNAAKQENIYIALRDRPLGAELYELLGVKLKPQTVKADPIIDDALGLRIGNGYKVVSDSDLGFVWKNGELAPNDYYGYLNENYGFKFQHGDHIWGMLENAKGATLDRAQLPTSTLITPDERILQDRSLIDMLKSLGANQSLLQQLLSKP